MAPLLGPLGSGRPDDCHRVFGVGGGTPHRQSFQEQVLTAGLLLYAACGVACFVSATLEQIAIARFVLGFALAAITTGTTALIGDYFTGATREAVFGWQNALRGVANTAFPIVGAAIALVDWRLIFL